ncbi:pyridoxal phosphate-dependent aminotransferase [Chromohalobacter sp. HP20-39]|uniref:pyridoxal phosphate-dependent aminotransferase n=1 Tax=Chromohalobacter sp. HP20-39 TaxID=3079306 RepID=UPI00294B5F55|nr:aminotransferase class I/II-fold pyridoxal phosphate-dependent enzyme [Chromohalobacter sp. HP20-39]MDV6319434.1 aminotransferase class I/II-fold pyridoxal phosphate-dependent enzyme [Chromohalobacter sp. HP20-39]
MPACVTSPDTSAPASTAADWLGRGYADDHNATAASDTLLINEQSRLLEQQGRRIIKFGFGQSPFPVFAPAVETLAEHAADKAYLPVQGMAALRDKVAAFHRHMDGTDWQAERVLIAPGSKLLLFALMKALPISEILIPAPAWVSYAPQVRLAGQHAMRLETSFDSRWLVTPEQLDRYCREHGPGLRLLILNAPGNPTGLSYEPEMQRELAAVAKRHGVLVLADEIYGPLHHRGEHRPFALDYPEGTLTTSGLSKWCGAGGWRLGVLNVPEALGDELLTRLLGIASETWSSVASPVQAAAITAYSVTPALEEYLETQRQWLSTIGRWCAQRLEAAGVRTHAPDGGFYLFPDFSTYREVLRARGITTSTELTEALLEEAGVALLPGSAFGCEPTQLTARLAYVDFDGAGLLEREPSVTLETAMADPDIGRVYEGIKAIVTWLNAR